MARRKKKPWAQDFRNAEATELFNSRQVYRELCSKLTPAEKMWLMDVGGDFRLYLSRLYQLAANYNIQILHPFL